MSTNVNPYKNTGEILMNKGIGNFQEYLNRVVKNTQINITLGEIMEYMKYRAFEDGKRQGKYEKAREINMALDVENPEFDNFVELD